MLQYRGANIQMLDVPGLIQGAAGGRGDGKAVLSVVRTADLIVFTLSPFEIQQYDRLQEELYANKVRVDREPPRVTVRRKHKDGIKVTSSADQDLDGETIKAIVREQGYVNADLNIGEHVDVDRLIDGILDNREYVPSIAAVNKADLINPEYKTTVDEALRERGVDPEAAVFISAEEEKGLDALKERIWQELDLVRVYMDKPGRGIDWDEPLVIPAESTVDDAMEKLGGEFSDRFKFARISGPSATHDEQQVGREHVLEDEDVMKLVLRK
jgi:ribosome-interacting GTPase 1